MVIHHVPGHRVAQHRIADAAVGQPQITLGDDIDRRRGAANGAADFGDHAALVLKQFFGDIPAAVDVAHQIGFGHFHVGEESFTEGRGAADEFDRPRFHAGTRHIE